MIHIDPHFSPKNKKISICRCAIPKPHAQFLWHRIHIYLRSLCPQRREPTARPHSWKPHRFVKVASILNWTQPLSNLMRTLLANARNRTCNCTEKRDPLSTTFLTTLSRCRSYRAWWDRRRGRVVKNVVAGKGSLLSVQLRIQFLAFAKTDLICVCAYWIFPSLSVFVLTRFFLFSFWPSCECLSNQSRILSALVLPVTEFLEGDTES